MFSLRPYQEAAKARIYQSITAGNRSICLVAPTGCHAKGQGILMYNGDIRLVEDIQVGEVLMGPDGPRRVTSLARGYGAMHKVTPVKGTPFIVNADHVLTLIRLNDGSKHVGNIVDISVNDWLTWNPTTKHVHKLFRVAATFEPQTAQLEIDPYFLGVILGDGSIIRGVSVHKNDVEVEELCLAQAAIHGLKIRTDRSGTCVSHFLVRTSAKVKDNPLTVLLDNLGLAGTRSGNKFVPNEYKTSTRENRLAIIAGLMDTDGSMARGGYDFISKSQDMAEDVVFIARSVGLAAYLRPCRKSCQNDFTGDYFRVSISGDCSIIPCRIARKKASPRLQIKNVLRTGFTITPCGDDDFYGFTLDGDGRYLLDDFTVTHNSGKTHIAASIIHDAVIKRSRRCVFLAHRRELINQCSAKLTEAGVPHGIIAAGTESADAPVQVCSIQTLSSQKTVLPILEARDLLITDECHRAHASKIREFYPDVLHLGLTATPCRHTSAGEEPLPGYDSLVIAATPHELVASGAIVPLRIRAPQVPDVSAADTGSGEYKPGLLSEIMQGKMLVGGLARDMAAHKTMSTVIFAVDIAHAKSIAEAIPGAMVVTGDTPPMRRDALIAAFRAGEFPTLINADLLIEGWDYPELRRIVLMRPTKSIILFLQQVGRGVRPADGKDHCEVWDYAGNILFHGDPYATREWSISKTKMTRKGRGIVLWRCPECFCVQQGAPEVCPICLTTVKKKHQRITISNGKLVEYDEEEMLRLALRRKEEEHRVKEERSLKAFRIKRLFWLARVKRLSKEASKSFAIGHITRYERSGQTWDAYFRGISK